MSNSFETQLARYAELAIKVGLNLQPGQRVFVTDALNQGVSLRAEPLVRQAAIQAYKAGAPYVEVMWADELLHPVRFQYAPPDSFDEFPTGLEKAFLAAVQRGDAILTIKGTDPDLLQGVDPDQVAQFQKLTRQKLSPATEAVRNNAVNWLVITNAGPGWAVKVFPHLPPEQAEAQLWETIFRLCRLDQPDPVAAWRTHIAGLAERSSWLTGSNFCALHYRAPGTDLRVGLPAGHIWRSGSSTGLNGVVFTPNLPTEEVFSLPHKDQVDGVVRASRPLITGGQVIEDFTLRFAGGRVVEATAKKGEALLRKLLETDPGAAHLGEVALVPNSSPISRSGLLFHNTLYDENASSHLAFGSAYPFTLQGGERMTTEQFAAAGGNTSLVHTDFMIGSGEMDIDGLHEDGSTEPVMRAGEWAFSI